MPSLENSLSQRVDSALQTSPHLNGRTWRFEAEGSRIVLHGEVGTFFQKQMAQEVVRRVAGVEQIDNCLQVIWG
jgi:osmotically-inducible protein OsmY